MNKTATRGARDVHTRTDCDDRSRAKRLETSEEIARALRIAPTRFSRAPRVASLLVALVAMCLVLAAVVWWRLLT